MSSARPVSAFATARTLWRRAPAWRMLVLTSSLATLLFILFAQASQPVPSESLAKLAALEKTTYTPKATASPAPASTPSVVAATTGGVAPAPAPAPMQARSPAPRTATLAMVTPQADPQAPSGLDPALSGHAYRGTARINGYDLPLPKGDWITLANSTAIQPTATGEVFFLGQVRNKRLVGALRIFAMRSKSLPGDGFDEVKSCSEANPYRIASVIDEPLVPHGHQACWTIRNIYSEGLSHWGDRAVRMSSIDRAAAGDMAAKGVTYPQDMISLTFTRTESWGLLEVGYLFSPEADGIHSTTVLSVRDSDWTAQNLAHEADKTDYIEKLKTWGNALWPQFKAAFAKGAPDNLPATPAERPPSNP